MCLEIGRKTEYAIKCSHIFILISNRESSLVMKSEVILSSTMKDVLNSMDKCAPFDTLLNNATQTSRDDPQTSPLSKTSPGSRTSIIYLA